MLLVMGERETVFHCALVGDSVLFLFFILCECIGVIDTQYNIISAGLKSLKPISLFRPNKISKIAVPAAQMFALSAATDCLRHPRIKISHTSNACWHGRFPTTVCLRPGPTGLRA